MPFYVNFQFIVVHLFLHAWEDEEIVRYDVEGHVHGVSLSDGFIQSVKVTFGVFVVMPGVVAVPDDVLGRDAGDDGFVLVDIHGDAVSLVHFPIKIVDVEDLVGRDLHLYLQDIVFFSFLYVFLLKINAFYIGRRNDITA